MFFTIQMQKIRNMENMEYGYNMIRTQRHEET